MIDLTALQTLVENWPHSPFDRYSVETVRARWPTLGPASLPVIYRCKSGHISPLLPFPNDGPTSSCVEVRDLVHFARHLIPHVIPDRPLSTAQAIDLGDLLSIALSALARRQRRKGPYAVFQASTRSSDSADGSASLNILWHPVAPPISVAIAVACIALSQGLIPEARDRLQAPDSPIRWRRACTIAARPGNEQMATIALLTRDTGADKVARHG